MNDNSDFYLTLLSNSSFGEYPENKTSSFTVSLPQNISLSGQWKVALAEVHYPYTIETVTSDNNRMIVEIVLEKSGEGVYGDPHLTYYNITEGHYQSHDEIISALNDEISRVSPIENLFFLSKDKRFVTFSKDKMEIFMETSISRAFGTLKSNYIKGRVRSIFFEGRLAMQLGYEPNVSILKQNAKAPPNVIFGVPPEMMIYCDLIEPQLIADCHSSVLKIIPTVIQDARYGQVVSKTFNVRSYVPLLLKNFKSVRIDIRDCVGKFIPFSFGTSYVLLHFVKS